MNNLFSYCGLVDVRINASDKDLPVITKWTGPERKSEQWTFSQKKSYVWESFVALKNSAYREVQMISLPSFEVSSGP